MSKRLEFSDEEHERIGQEIEDFLEFTRDVLNDPSFLGYIPDGSSVTAIPIAERDPNVHYDIETARYLAIVTPGGMDDAASSARPNGRTRRIDRDNATRLKRIRAAHR